MRIFSFLTCVASVLLASATPKVTVTPIDETPGSNNNPSKIVSTSDVLFTEDFSEFVDGTVEEPYLGASYGDKYTDDRIPTYMTHGLQWRGHKVYSAGGSLALRTTNPQDPSYLLSPAMDYSGSVKVTLKARYLFVEWSDEEGTWHWPGGSIHVGLISDSGKTFNTSEGTINSGGTPRLADVRLYPDQGWCKITVEFDNYSAHNDAHIMLSCGDGVVVDDIEVDSSVDSFIANPDVTGISNVTDTSFTVNFEPVRKAYNYYIYLLERTGFDEQGNPIYDVTMPKDYIDEALAEMKKYGMEMTWEEYKAMMGFDLSSPYTNVGKVEKGEPCAYTIEGLDPEKDYFVAVRAHYVNTFSEINPIEVKEIAAPIAKYATSITNTGFTANWEPITKAEKYEVSLYGVNRATSDESEFIIFEEEFDNVDAYCESDNIFDPEIITSDQEISLDDLTSTPGWQTNADRYPIVKGQLGTMYYGNWLRTPEIWVANNDMITVTMKAETTDFHKIYLKFAGVTYEFGLGEGVYEGEFDLPTFGMKESRIEFACENNYSLFLDYIIVRQSLKKGDFAFTYMGSVITDETSYTFSDIDSDLFDLYGFGVRSLRGEDKNQVKSEQSERIIADLKNSQSFTGLEKLDSNENDLVEIARYSLDGQRIDKSFKGIQIVRYSDGSCKKMIVK